MVFPKARLAVSAALFDLWLAFLAYLVSQTRNPVILSRPQFLVADRYVVAQLSACADGPCSEAKILEVVWSRGGADLQPGQVIRVEGLADCGRNHGWSGPDEYVLALSRLENGG